MDPEFFILVEVLPFEQKPSERDKAFGKLTIDMKTHEINAPINVKIHKKVYLKQVESLVDRSEPRNLIMGFSDKIRNSGVGNLSALAKLQ